jgi:hypothetical protein
MRYPGSRNMFHSLPFPSRPAPSQKRIPTIRTLSVVPPPRAVSTANSMTSTNTGHANVEQMHTHIHPRVGLESKIPVFGRSAVISHIPIIHMGLCVQVGERSLIKHFEEERSVPSGCNHLIHKFDSQDMRFDHRYLLVWEPVQTLHKLA